MSFQTESSLFQKARQGSPEAVNAVFERYGSRLHALIRARLGPNLRRRLESRDILQATLLKAFRGIDRFAGSGSRSLMAWLGTIAVCEIRDQAEFYQRQKRDYARDTGFGTKADRVAESIRSVVSRLQMHEEALRLERSLDALSAAHREVVLLRSFEELSFGEIGERLGKSPDACRMLYARALTALTLSMQRDS